MISLVIVDDKKYWNLDLKNVEVVTAKSYLTESHFSGLRNIRVYNLCRSYKYKRTGYYVSLLAEARGHRVFPRVTAMQDMKSQAMVKILSDDIDQLIQKSFAKLKSNQFDLSIYFGKNIAKQYDKLSVQLYNLFQSPLLRARFVYHKKWMLQTISTISLDEVPLDHHGYLYDFAKQYFAKSRLCFPKQSLSNYDLAILVNPYEKVPPSDKKAIDLFLEAAKSIGLNAELITKNDFNLIPSFDALFIRETTAVNHHTYRFARRAVKENLVVIDDPDSILRCTNKVYLEEVFAKFKIPRPKTLIVHKKNHHEIEQYLGFPCVLKEPDSSFSQGVIKVADKQSLKMILDDFLSRSELIIAQEFLPTEFDWRVGVLDQKPLFACKYYMAKDHWQIYNWLKTKEQYDGEGAAVPLDQVPSQVISVALRAARLIGDGLYGVDLKQVKNQVYTIEVNDNPSIDYGVEDYVSKDELYLAIMKSFLHRIKRKKEYSP